MASLLAEKVVQPAFNAHYVAFCPTVKLIALASTDEKIHVYRLNGQAVFALTDRQRGGRVTSLAWKPDGYSIAAAFSSNVLCLASSRTGKVIHRLDCTGFSDSQISCIGWGVNSIEEGRSYDLAHVFRSIRDGQGGGDKGPDRDRAAKQPDLPRDLALLHVEKFLPRLSPLSPGGVEDDIFSSRASLDTIFGTDITDEDDLVDVLAVCFEDGSLHLSIYDQFEIGTFSVTDAFEQGGDCKAIAHSFHRSSTTHTLVVQSAQDGHQQLSLLAFDMRLLSSAGSYLATLASKSSQMRNLLRYIHQAHVQILSEFKGAFELPRRFISNVEESLREQGDWNWSQAAYHLVMTGNCPEIVKEWLVDQLGERGHKRWDKAVTTGYENTRRLTQEHLLPALERLMVLTSRLLGLSKFHVSNHFLGLSTRRLEQITDTICCLQLVAHKILSICTIELAQFRAFSFWLRQEIDIQSSEADAPDSTELDIKIDHESVLQYVSGPMLESDLKIHLGPYDSESQPQDACLENDSDSLFDRYKDLAAAGNDSLHKKRLPHLGSLLKIIGKQSHELLSGIADVQRKGVRFGSPFHLADSSSRMLDMRMIVQSATKSSTSQCVQFIAIGESTHGPAHSIGLYRSSFSVQNGMSMFGPVERARIMMGKWRLEDLRFLDDQQLLFGISSAEASHLMMIDYRKTTFVKKAPAESKNDTPRPYIDLTDIDAVRAHSVIEFPKGSSWVPYKVVTNYSAGKRTVCILAKDNLRYRIYELASKSDDAGGFM